MKRLAVVSASAVALLVTVSALAGTVLTTATVSVDTTNMVASGSMGEAYQQFTTGDGVEYIACITLNTAGSGGSSDVFCYATNASNVSVSCAYISSNPPGVIAQTLTTLTQDALVSFYWNSGGNCTQVVSEPASFSPPQ